ncbi:hypothetical protein WJX73_000538 [Symbiochloris irregularis]|uniref:Major facilitator superfamily (MFS) profile domain-containing protein n=1 Tax=Symbiochloris irregularis TaxID=706552 RepID=A0AAW1PR74_9CHLO
MSTVATRLSSGALPAPCTNAARSSNCTLPRRGLRQGLFGKLQADSINALVSSRQTELNSIVAHASVPGLQPRLLQLAEKQVSLIDHVIAQVQIFLAEHERVLVVAASTLIMSLSHTALRPVLPVFAKGFGVGATAIGVTLSVYAGARLMMNIPAGLIGDAQGRKPLLVWGPAITAIGMLGCGMSTSFRQLLVWRWVTGIGSALQMTGAQLFLADISKPGNRARSLGLNQSASLLGSLAGPAIGGFLADYAGINAPFTFTGIAAGLAALYGAIRLPETRQRHEDLDNETGPSGSRVEVSKQSQGRSTEAGSPSTSAAASAPEPAGSLQHNSSNGSSAPRRRKGRRRPGWWQLLGSRDFRAVALLNAVMFATQNGGRSVLLPLMAIDGFGFTTSLLGLLFAGMAVVSLIGIMPAAFVADHLGRKWSIVPSCLGMAAALMIMANTGCTEAFTAAAVMYAAANACLGATPSAYAADVMPASISGFGLGIYRCAGDLGLMFGPALLGWIADLTSVRVALQANAVILAGAVCLFSVQARETRHLRARHAKPAVA